MKLLQIQTLTEVNVQPHYMLDLNTNQDLVGSLATIFPDESVHTYNIFTI